MLSTLNACFVALLKSVKTDI